MITIDWLNVEINEKMYKRLLIIGICVMIGYLTITFVSFAIPKRYVMKEGTVLDTEKTVQNGIDHLHRGIFALEISGWAYQEGQGVETFNSSFILKNRETEKMYLIRTGVKDVPELQFVDGKNCLKCGLTSRSLVFGMKKGCYDLYILYQNNDENLLVNTNVEVRM